MPVRVVAMDDDPDILRLVRIKLTKEGFEVITAADGEELRFYISYYPV